MTEGMCGHGRGTGPTSFHAATQLHSRGTNVIPADAGIQGKAKHADPVEAEPGWARGSGETVVFVFLGSRVRGNDVWSAGMTGGVRGMTGTRGNDGGGVRA